MCVEEVEVYDVCWIYLIQDRDQWWWASCVHVKVCEVSQLCEDVLAL